MNRIQVAPVFSPPSSSKFAPTESLASRGPIEAALEKSKKVLEQEGAEAAEMKAAAQ